METNGDGSNSKYFDHSIKVYIIEVYAMLELGGLMMQTEREKSVEHR